MSFMIAVAGFAGSGKTLATQYLASVVAGHRLYLGGRVLEVVRTRGLEETPENERTVRLDLRKKNPAALAVMEKKAVEDCFSRETPVVIDAVFCAAEWNALLGYAGARTSKLIALTSSFSTRHQRLECRSVRPINAGELERRDNTEISDLGILHVFEKADISLMNEGTREELTKALDAIVACLS